MQFFKENYPMVKLVKDKLQDSSIEQYKMKNELYLKNSAETVLKEGY
jgi:hypothetical protein